MMSVRSAFGRVAVTAAAASTLAVLAAAGTASAHVTVDAGTVARQGGYAAVTLNVPNETSDAATVKLSVQLPQDRAITSVSAQPKPGWTVAITTRQLTTPVSGDDGSIDEVVDTVTWTADAGAGIQPHQFDQFRISMGPLPTDVDALTLPTVQSYDDGQDVRWIETTAGAAHPAPRLTLLAATGTASDDHDGSNALAWTALVVGAVALVVAAGGVALGRRRSAA
jgi:uncharacterized protein YcnI